MDKKKLLIVTHHLTIGGVQKSLISALKVLDYEKFDVTLYVRKNRTALLPYVDERVKVIINEDSHHYYRKPICILLQIFHILCKKTGLKKQAEIIQKKLGAQVRKYEMRYEKKKYFSSVKYDIAVAYVQGYTALFTDECVKAEKKYVFFHASTDEYPEVHKNILSHFDKVVALHDDQKKLLGEWYPEIKEKICIVRNYTDKALITNQSLEEEIPVPKDKTVLCSCGRFAPVKGFDLAVEAAKNLRDNGVPFVWYFVGDGPERGNIENLIEKYNLKENIIITGMQKNPYPYMAACDIYIQPSYQEAMPLTLIEAVRLNKPMITTDTVGGRKLVDNTITGLVCDINPKSIADAVESLIKNKDFLDEIKNNLKNTDYSKEFNQYKIQWQNLLEE